MIHCIESLEANYRIAYSTYDKKVRLILTDFCVSIIQLPNYIGQESYHKKAQQYLAFNQVQMQPFSYYVLPNQNKLPLLRLFAKLYFFDVFFSCFNLGTQIFHRSITLDTVARCTE